MPEPVILIVDDEPNVLKSIKRLLIDSDYNIVTASSGEQALEKVKQLKIDVAISDYRMPGMNGVEFLSKVKEISPDTMRIILSGYADAVAIVEAINEGQVYRYITKPWNDQELLTTISTSVEQHNLQQEYEVLYHELQRKNRALEDSARTLENEVTRRTRDLEIKNRALMLAQNILNYLPVGVLGVDPEESIVYMNDAMRKYLPHAAIGLSMNVGEILCDEQYRILKRCIKEGKVYAGVLEIEEQIAAIWIPLPDSNGAIGLYHFMDLNRYQTKISRSHVEAGYEQ